MKKRIAFALLLVQSHYQKDSVGGGVMPIPQKDEEKQEFISRCIETLTKEKSDHFTSREQRAAVCYSQWGEYEKESGMAVDEPKKSA